MSKKRSNLKVVTTSAPAAKGMLVNSPSRTAEQSEVSQSTQNALRQSFGTQIFSSEEQALEVLIAQVVSRYEDDPSEQAEMREFLSTVLDTDPVLRSEILAGATIRR